MGITHLSGLAVAGVPTMGMSGIPATAGNVWFVNSVSGSNGNPGTAQFPLATIAQAVSLATADNGDIIVLTAGHAETISAAGGITINKSGLVIWCLGEGADRPTLTFATSTAATFLITSGNFQIGGAPLVCICNIASLVTGFDVRAANVTINAEWRDTSAAVAALRAVLTTAAAVSFNCNLVYIGLSANAINVNAIRLVGGRDAVINVNYYGAVTTAIVEFATTAVINAQISGYFYSSGTTNFSKTVVDTITGSTWSVSGFDGAAGLSFDGGSGKAIAGNDVSTVIADLAVGTTDATTNALERDVIGNKSDAGVTVVGTTKSITAYAKGLVTMGTVQTADSTANAFAGDVVGNKTDAGVTAVGTTKSIAAYAKGLVTMNTVQAQDSTADAFMGDVVGNKTDTAVYVPGTTKSLAAYLKGSADLQEGVATGSSLAMVNGNTIFTIAGGPIQILSLISLCKTVNDATASTLQYQAASTLGTLSQTISGASATLANAAAGSTVNLVGTTLATAAAVNANAAGIGGTTVGIFAMAGTIKLVIGTGSTTGTWQHFIRYRPLATGVTVTGT